MSRATTDGRSGNAGPNTMPEAGSGQRCGAPRPSLTAPPHETRTARPQKSISASHPRTASTPPAPPWPCACPDVNRERESLAPGTGHATTPHKGRHDHKAACRYRSPIRLFMTAGQVTDHAGAAALPGSLPKAGWLLADRGHGADCFREASKDRGDKDRGIMPTIPGGRRAASR